MVVTGESLECTDFQLLLFVGLRALIDKLGAATFNVGIFNIGLDSPGREPSGAAPLFARCLFLPALDVQSTVPLSPFTGKPSSIVCWIGFTFLSASK